MAKRSGASRPSSRRSLRGKRGTSRPATAEEMSARQRSISVAEFFTKNRHLLGFDNPRRALLTTVKEAVDNSLDACEEAGILPEIKVKIEVLTNGNGQVPPTPAQATRFRVTVADNGPGIVKKQVPRIFAKLLYGSKFHRLLMSRGQQGIGISAAGMYGQLTTGKPTVVISKTKREPAAHYFEVTLDSKRNEPQIHEGRPIEWDREHGTQVSICLEGRYNRGRASVDEYLEQTSVANPHVRLVYCAPDDRRTEYRRGSLSLPVPPREIKPHPYGIELGMLGKMLKDTAARRLSGFLTGDFVRISPRTAKAICEKANLSPDLKPRTVFGEKAERLFDALKNTKLMAPPTDCISPIGEKAVLAGLYKQIRGDFYTAVTRSPAVYRGNSFAVEAGLAYGTGVGAKPEEGWKNGNGNGNGDEGPAEGEGGKNKSPLAKLIRYANRVPLLHQQSSCCITKAVMETPWRNYGLSQSRGTLPQGPLVIFVHLASVWVPFTSEAKEAIADYDEIHKEIKLALQEAGRRLGVYLRKRKQAQSEFKRRNVFQLYIGEVVAACNRIKKGKLNTERLAAQLLRTAHERTGGDLTDKLLKKGRAAQGNGRTPDEKEPANTIIVTEDGVRGAVPQIPKETGPAAPTGTDATTEKAGPTPSSEALPKDEVSDKDTDKRAAGKTTSKKKGGERPGTADGAKGKRRKELFPGTARKPLRRTAEKTGKKKKAKRVANGKQKPAAVGKRPANKRTSRRRPAAKTLFD